MKSPHSDYLLSRGLPPEWARSATARIYSCREGCCGRQLLRRRRWWRLSYGQKDDISGGCNHALVMMQTSASGTTSSLGLDLLLKRAQKLLGIEMVSPGLEMVRFGIFGISIGSLYMIDACINRPLSATDCDATSRKHPSIHRLIHVMPCHNTAKEPL
jgi:hypothetical protein